MAATPLPPAPALARAPPSSSLSRWLPAPTVPDGPTWPKRLPSRIDALKAPGARKLVLGKYPPRMYKHLRKTPSTHCILVACRKEVPSKGNFHAETICITLLGRCPSSSSRHPPRRHTHDRA